MRRRSSIITFNQPASMPSTNWQQTSIVDSRKMSTASIQSNTSSNSQKNNIDPANVTYQAPQLIRYSTVFSSICLESKLTCAYITYAFLVSHFNRTLVDWIYDFVLYCFISSSLSMHFLILRFVSFA